MKTTRDDIIEDIRKVREKIRNETGQQETGI